MDASQEEMETAAALKLTVSAHKRRESLTECVSDALENFFARLGDETPTELYAMVMEQVEKPMLKALYQHVDGNQVKAAQILGLSRGTVRKKLLKYKIL